MSLAKRMMWLTFGEVFFALILLSLVVIVINADLSARLTERQLLGTVTVREQPLHIPTLRLVLHRVLADENTIEASLVLLLDAGAVREPYWRRRSRLKASIRDGSNLQPVLTVSPIEVDLLDTRSLKSGLALGSNRFHLPIVPSEAGFPFDDVKIFVTPQILDASGYLLPFNFEVQKALPGRLLISSGHPLAPEIRLSRSSTEKALVLFGGLVFLFLSATLIFVLVKSPAGIRGWEELLAFAGYLLGAAGFRDMLGVTRGGGTSTFEVVVFGAPLISLAVAMSFSLLQSRKKASEPERR